MATTLISSDILSGTNNITAGDEVVVLPDVVVFEDNQAAFHLLEGTFETVLVNYGLIIGGTSSSVIDLESDSSTVINHGTISHIGGDLSTTTAVFDLAGGSTASTTVPTDTNIINYGLIEGNSAFFDDFGADGPYNVIIENLGTIRTDRDREFMDDDLDLTNVRITNSGTMIGGDLELDGDGQSVLQNSGRFEMRKMDINAVNGALIDNSGIMIIGDLDGPNDIAGGFDISTILNSGTLTANLDLSGGNDVFRNSGTFTGTINMDGEEDTVENIGGIIDGTVNMGDGNDTLINTGTILGLVDMSVGDDSLLNTGTIANNVSTGALEDTVTNRGLIDGVLDMGSSNDTYRALGDGVVTGSILGSTGDDLLIGGGLADVIDGGNDNDTLRGKGGDDTLLGADGEDYIYGGSGDDSMCGGTGNDMLHGGAGADNLSGGDDQDTLKGGSGDDTLLGGSGQDDLRGGDGNDVLETSGKGDVLNGGRGDDTLTSGGGNDEFVFGIKAGDDVITDFADGNDKIDLSAYNLQNFNALNSSGALSNLSGDGVIIDLSVIGGVGSITIEGALVVGDFSAADFIF